jgi:hypothetical protein
MSALQIGKIESHMSEIADNSDLPNCLGSGSRIAVLEMQEKSAYVPLGKYFEKRRKSTLPVTTRPRKSKLAAPAVNATGSS